MKSRILILLASAVAATGLAGARPAVAAVQGGDNTAIAVNTKDGSTLIKVASGAGSSCPARCSGPRQQQPGRAFPLVASANRA